VKSVKGVIPAVFLTIGLSPLFCANISILVIETGLQDGKPLRGGEVTSLWEAGLMDVFFESGHIVTNVQSFALKETPAGGLPPAVGSHISDAGDAGVDYFILACIGYEQVQEESRAAEPAKPAGIEFTMYRVRPEKRVWMERIDFGGKVYGGKEQRARVRRAALSLLARLGGSI
jgi:hypothetical protein